VIRGHFEPPPTPPKEESYGSFQELRRNYAEVKELKGVRELRYY